MLLKRILELSHEYDAYGYRFITALLRRERWTLSYKKVQRLRRKEGLGLVRRPRKKGRCGQLTEHKQRAGKVNKVWFWDFIHDVTEGGRSIRILSIVDEHSQFCIALEVLRSFIAKDVIQMRRKVIRQFGAFGHLHFASDLY